MNEEITFPVADEKHPYSGMPLFDGKKEHFDAYLDTLLDYAGLEGVLLWANEYRHDYVLTTGEHAGAKIPGTLLWGESTDSVQGYKTDFPCMMGLGQSWDTDLVHRVGRAIGREYITQTDHNCGDSSKFSALICTAMQDMRVNPLSGRFDEGFSEDPMLSSEMVDSMARGVAGTDDERNPDGFWMRSCVATKHFTTYGGQTFRMSQSNDISIRGLMEHQIKAPTKGVASGALGGFMMSFGRTNGIPNTISPAISHLQKLSPYGLYSTPDIFGTSIFWQRDTYKDGQGNFSNHYDKSYIPPELKAASAALMPQAQSGGYILEPDTIEEGMKELLNIANAGVAGVTKEQLIREAKNNLAPYVRLGFFNENFADYPFYPEEKRDFDAHTKSHKDAALQSARESIVLLKNNGILPLSGKESVALCGCMADARFKTVYAARNLPDLPNCGLTVKESMEQFWQEKGGKVSYASDGRLVRIKANDRYLMISDTDPESENFGRIGFTYDLSKAEVFEQYSWGQFRAFSYRSVKSGLWFSSNGVQADFLAPIEPTVLKVNEEMSLIQKNTTLSGVLSGITLPTRIRLEEQEDGSYLFLIHGYNESLIQLAPDAYYKMGRYVKVDGNTLHYTAPLGDKLNQKRRKKEAARFTFEPVREMGTQTIEAAGESDVAVVVVGACTRHSAGEGVDRSDLFMGEDSYTLVDRVAENYPQKTIVIVNSSFPVSLKSIEENENVAAILYQPYAGEYDGYAMGEVLTGQFAPTGRLTATWYASEDALPKLDAYSVPEGPDSAYTPWNMDPRLVSDLRKQDLIAEKLTYQYSDAEITYHIGHGLSYSSFTYENLRAEDWTDVTKPLKVTLDLTNTGNVDTAEVVQCYMTNPRSAYGKQAPKQTLAAFARVELKAGKTKTVTLTIKPEDVSLWDVNAGEYFVEGGDWILQVGHASDQILLMQILHVNGRSLSALDTEARFNLFSRCALGLNVTYRERSKKGTLKGLKAMNGYRGMDGSFFSVMSKEAGASALLKKVNLSYKSTISMDVSSLEEGGYIEMRLDRPNGLRLAKFTVPKTEPVSYQIPNTGEDPLLYPPLPVQEAGYVTLTQDLREVVAGNHDVWIIFSQKDIRIGDMKIS